MDIQSLSSQTGCLSKVTLAAGTTTTISTTGTTTYGIRSKAYSKTAITNGATPTTDAATGLAFPSLSANQGAVVLVGLDASGNVKATQGGIQSLDVSGSFLVAPQFGAIPDNFCPIGYIVLKAGSTLVGTWTFGSNNLSSVTGMTYTFEYLAELAFMEEPVMIRIEPSQLDNAAMTVDCACNGKGAEILDARTGKWLELNVLPVGLVVTTKRKYVEILARAKTMRVQTPDHADGKNIDKNDLTRRHARTHVFSVIKDTDRGTAWLTAILSESF
jgi:hypothetical protein